MAMTIKFASDAMRLLSNAGVARPNVVDSGSPDTRAKGGIDPFRTMIGVP
jgi:hypothetical protein